MRIGDISIAVEERGPEGAPAVAFVHGLGGCAYGWWAQLAAAEARGYRAVAHDQRGAGLSDKPAGPYSVELWAEDVVRLLDALGIERAALVGHSVGCMVAEHAAVALGERCWALAVLGGALAWPPESRPVFEQRAALARDGRMSEIAAAVAATGVSEAGRERDPRLHGLMLRLVASNDPEGYALSALATADGVMERFESLACPVLAFAGRLDPVTPPAAAAAIADACPRGETAVVEGAAHWAMLEAPDAVNDALFAFLDLHRPA